MQPISDSSHVELLPGRLTMAHRTRRGISKVEFNKRIRDAVSRDSNKLRQTFDKFDKEYASRMAEIHSMQEKVRHSMRSLAMDKKHVQETSDHNRKTDDEKNPEERGTKEATKLRRNGANSMDPLKLNARRNPRMSVGHHLPSQLEISAENKRRYSLPLYRSPFTTGIAKSNRDNPRESPPRLLHSQGGFPQFPTNHMPKVSSPPQREIHSRLNSPKDTPSLAPKELHSSFHVPTSRREHPRLSINSLPASARVPMATTGVRRRYQAYGSAPASVRGESFDEKKDLARGTQQNPKTASRVRSVSLCRALQPVVAMVTETRRLSDSDSRKMKNRTFSLPSNPQVTMKLPSEVTHKMSSPDSKPRRSSPAIPIPGQRKNDIDDVEADAFEELYQCRYLRNNDVEE